MPPPRSASLIGTSNEMAMVRQQVSEAAQRDTPLAVTGPAGSGKRLVARLVHQQGPRADRPLVTIDCGQPDRDRLLAELFGDNPAGRVAIGHDGRADGGTVYLSACDHLDPPAQIRLLRALDLRRVQQLAGTSTGADLMRLIVGSTVDLAAAVAVERFDADLYDRLAVSQIALPTLTERPEDIPLLVEHFAVIEAQRSSRPRFTADALAYLGRQSWIGNVRALRNVVVRAGMIHQRDPIDEARVAVLVHGERRWVDRWLDSATNPMPMPNRRRPPPIIAAGEVVDLRTLLTDFEQSYIRDVFHQTAFGAVVSGSPLGARQTMLLDTIGRQPAAPSEPEHATA